nr:Retrovirus-related Pol polyprotein from transposon TNT 1-94 [Ipomoea batatas]
MELNENGNRQHDTPPPTCRTKQQGKSDSPPIQLTPTRNLYNTLASVPNKHSIPHQPEQKQPVNKAMPPIHRRSSCHRLGLPSSICCNAAHHASPSIRYNVGHTSAAADATPTSNTSPSPSICWTRKRHRDDRPATAASSPPLQPTAASPPSATSPLPLQSLPRFHQNRHRRCRLVGTWKIETKKILGMEIHRDCQAGKLYLSQKKYVEKVLDRFNMSNCNPVSTPFGAHFKLSSDSCPKSDVDVAYMSKVPYSSAVGSLIWKATLQSIAALSTTEAEYIAATEDVKEATWLRGLVMELGVSQGIFLILFLSSMRNMHEVIVSTVVEEVDTAELLCAYELFRK